MNVLVTGAASPLGRAAAEALRKKRHTLRLTDRRRVRTDHEFTQSQLGHGPSTNKLVAGIETIVHLPAPIDPGADPAAWIDACTRCTYNLLVAAAQAGVRHVVYVGSLASFTEYDPDFLVSESWRPQPTTDAPVMAPNLGEFVAKEFAQTKQLQITILRLGHLVIDELDSDTRLDPTSIDVRDAATGIAAAVKGDGSDYRLLHLQGQFEGARFSADRAVQQLGIKLRHDFGRPADGAAG